MLKAATRAGEISFDLTKTIANFQMHAVDEIARRHSLSRFRLDFEQSQRSLISTAHYEFVSLCNNDLAGRRVRHCRSLSTPDREPFCVVDCVRVGPRLKTSDAALNLERAPRPVDQTVFFFQYRSERGIAVMLRTRREIIEARESFTQQPRAHFRQPLHPLRRSLFLADRRFALQQDWTSV